MKSETEKPTIGFIGIGNMGSRMSMNILKSGYPLFVLDIDPTRYAEHIKQGAKAAKNPKELAEKSDVIISMLAMPATTEMVILGTGKLEGQGVAEAIEGKILIDMSTNLPAVVRNISKRIKEKGGKFLESPVMGSVVPAAQGTLSMLPAGEKEVYEEVLPILKTMGKKLWFIEGTGMGCSMKLTMNLHLNIITAAFSESLVFGTKAGLDPKMIVDIWNNSIFKTYITETKGESVIKGDYSPTFNLEWALKDMHLASELAREVKTPILLGSIVKQIYSASIANGKKDLDWTVMINLYEKLANISISKE